ncbi:hypothetical protein PS880_05417 [Pseudomonas fluorescens]|uniref:Uncharacterized protein n=1 Tax=Pseudomonas fluorescens TaxID=294 RepID=A0A5E7PS87_PSEFL|nr:hypothetical protein PS880_05417 [Pseudomonas fluorescens]
MASSLMTKKISAITNLQPVISALSNGDSKLGEMLARKILKKQPRNAEVLHLCGVACLMRGRAEEAEALLLQALSLRDDASYWLKLALTRQKLDNDEGAETAFRQCLLLQPDNAQAANNLGNILKQQYRFAEAEEHYRNAIAHNPNYILAYPFASATTTHINVRIIGIAHETMAPPLQFAVEFVEQNVRQQRRERAALRRPFLPSADEST